MKPTEPNERVIDTYRGCRTYYDPVEPTFWFVGDHYESDFYSCTGEEDAREEARKLIDKYVPKEKSE
jgi:hypothetical protein